MNKIYLEVLHEINEKLSLVHAKDVNKDSASRSSDDVTQMERNGKLAHLAAKKRMKGRVEPEESLSKKRFYDEEESGHGTANRRIKHHQQKREDDDDTEDGEGKGSFWTWFLVFLGVIIVIVIVVVGGVTCAKTNKKNRKKQAKALKKMARFF